MAPTNNGTDATAQVLERLHRSAPRVQCLTNTVAQAISANCLHALGVRASMATHPDEIVAMSRSAGALLVNLGTIERVRLDALARLLDDVGLKDKPLVLYPEFVQHSPLRLVWAKRVLGRGRVIVKGNADEIAALRAHFADAGCRPVAIVTTGAIDLIEAPCREPIPIGVGHPYMAQVTGLGCAAGVRRFSVPRIDTSNTHGTGCSSSAAIAAGLALGLDLEAAITGAKRWLTDALLAARDQHIGHGHGPVDHFHDVTIPDRRSGQ